MKNDLLGINLNAEVLKIAHSALERSGDSLYQSKCPVCKEGILLVRRDWNTRHLLNYDICILCGQQVEYTDISNNKIFNLKNIQFKKYG